MEQNNQSNFSVITTPKSNKDSKKGLIIGVIIVLFLVISIPAGVYLVSKQQDIKEKAEAALYCPDVEACPVAGQATLLKSCYSAGTGEAPDEFSCSTIANVGTTAFCGSTEYCCPSLGASWTSDLTLCASPSPTAEPTEIPEATSTATASAKPLAALASTATPTPTPTPTNTSTATSTSKSTPTPTSTSRTATDSSTAVPIPVTGTNWPSIIGAGIGVLVIVGSILLVL